MAAELRPERGSSLEALRRELLDRRRALDPLQRASWSVAIQRRVIELPAFEGAGTLALYSALGGEPDTRALWEVARRAGKRVVLPAIDASGQPEFRLAGTPEALSIGQLGFQEPARGAAIPVVTVDLIVMPGLGFDRHGHRLGRGKGFYDRLLARRRADSTAVGLTFEDLLLERFDPEPHDVRMDLVVTETASYPSTSTGPIPSH
jgi:5-formyltetrahydrofolate cyclo-ligase